MEILTGKQTWLVGAPDARKRACPVWGALDGDLLPKCSKALSFDPGYMPTEAQHAPAGLSLPGPAGPSPRGAERWQHRHRQRETLP